MSEGIRQKEQPPNVIELLKTSENEKSGIIEKAAVFFSVIIFLLTLPFSLIFCVKVANEFQRVVVFRLGRLRKGGPRGPGLFFILPCIDDITFTDLRTVSLDVQPQEVISKDSVTIKVDAVIFFRLYDPLRAVIQVRNYKQASLLLSQTTLRSICGKRVLIDLLSKKEALSSEMLEVLDKATSRWGIHVERVEIKDVQLPPAMQRAMAAEAEAAREARAKLVAAIGEKDAAQALREASDVISENPTALQLRYLQTLVTVAAEKNETIIFPFPYELFSHWMQK